MDENPTTWQPWLDVLRNLILSGILVSAITALIYFGKMLRRVEEQGERFEEFRGDNKKDHEKIITSLGEHSKLHVSHGENIKRLDERVGSICHAPQKGRTP